MFSRLVEQDQIVFRFRLEDGRRPNGKFPFQSERSVYDISAICNDTGTVCGMMPHPKEPFSDTNCQTGRHLIVNKSRVLETVVSSSNQ